ncbi:MAG: hypothetical protein ACFFA0_10765 [Promethearchaeota archaeon]
MRQIKLKNLVLLIIISNLMFFSIYSMANSDIEEVVIDGYINESEWANADWKIPFFLDVDNAPDYNGAINVDGENVLYLGEDSINLYLAIDLCSDRSNNETDEWIGVWLNTANRTFDNYFDWVDFFNNGTESLIHDVENDQPWEYYTDYVIAYSQYINDDTEIIPFYGTTDGNADALRSGSSEDFNVTSETIGADELYWINFSVDLSKWYPLQDELDVIQSIAIEIGTEHNVSINEHKLILWNSDGTLPPLNDPQQVISLNNLSIFQLEYINYGLANLTIDNKLQFSLFGNNSAPFLTHLNPLDFFVYRNYTNWAGTVRVPYSTIANYQIGWSFGSSPNNANDHRMFEFSIPKTELELYNESEDLGIIVGGYGTLSHINGTNHWVFSTIDYWQYVEESSYYNYYNMMGPSKSVGIISGYSLILLVGIASVCSVVVIKKKLK